MRCKVATHSNLKGFSGEHLLLETKSSYNLQIKSGDDDGGGDDNDDDDDDDDAAAAAAADDDDDDDDADRCVVAL